MNTNSNIFGTNNTSSNNINNINDVNMDIVTTTNSRNNINDSKKRKFEQLYREGEQQPQQPQKPIIIKGKFEIIKNTFFTVLDFVDKILKNVIYKKPIQQQVQNNVSSNIVTQNIVQLTPEQIRENAKKVLPEELFAKPGEGLYISPPGTTQTEESLNVLFPLALRKYNPNVTLEYNANIALLGLTDMMRQILGDDLLQCVTKEKPLREVFELTNPTVQCNNTIGKFIDEKTVCWICGSVITKSDEPLSQECEHVFPIAQAIMFTGLYAPALADSEDENNDDYLRLLLLEYYWAHMICNRVKNDTHFIDYINDEFCINSDRILDFLNEIKDTSSYGGGNIICKHIGKTYIDRIKNNSYTFIDTPNKNIDISSTIRKIGKKTNDYSENDYLKIGQQILIDRLPIIFTICNRIIEEYKNSGLNPQQLVNNVVYDVKGQIAKNTSCIDTPVSKITPSISGYIQNKNINPEYYLKSSFKFFLKSEYTYLHSKIDDEIQKIIRNKFDRFQRAIIKDEDLKLHEECINSLVEKLHEQQSQYIQQLNTNNEAIITKELETLTITTFYEQYLKCLIEKSKNTSLKTLYDEIQKSNVINTYDKTAKERISFANSWKDAIQQQGGKYGTNPKFPNRRNQNSTNIPQKNTNTSQNNQYTNIPPPNKPFFNNQNTNTSQNNQYTNIPPPNKPFFNNQNTNTSQNNININEEPITNKPFFNNQNTNTSQNNINIYENPLQFEGVLSQEANEVTNIEETYSYKIENLKELYNLITQTINPNLGLEVKQELYDENRYKDEYFKNTYGNINDENIEMTSNNIINIPPPSNNIINIPTSNNNIMTDTEGGRKPLYTGGFKGSSKPKLRRKNV